MVWPPLPTLIRGAGGPITVRRSRTVRPDGVDSWGVWIDSTRTIRIDKTARIEHQWRVLFHELSHAALHDAGLENAFEDKVVEAIADCMATSAIQIMRGELGIHDS